MKWHQLETDEVLRECNTRPEGLTPTEVEERQKQYGPNGLPEAEDASKLRLLLHQFTSPLIYILLVAAIVIALLKEFIDTGVIVAVVTLNAIVGFFQEYKAETSVRALRNMVVARALK
jgi:magnesium-transporting ATPase (P-type)